MHPFNFPSNDPFLAPKCPTDKGYIVDERGNCICPPGYAVDEDEHCQPCPVDKG